MLAATQGQQQEKRTPFTTDPAGARRLAKSIDRHQDRDSRASRVLDQATDDWLTTEIQRRRRFHVWLVVMLLLLGIVVVAAVVGGSVAAKHH